MSVQRVSCVNLIAVMMYTRYWKSIASFVQYSFKDDFRDDPLDFLFPIKHNIIGIAYLMYINKKLTRRTVYCDLPGQESNVAYTPGKTVKYRDCIM